MSKTYCGRECELCTYKEELNCPECKSGPGKEFNGSMREELEAENLYKKRAPFLGKWLWLLFWVAISTEIARIITKKIVAMWAPVLMLVGGILLIVCMFAYSIILLVLSSDNAAYKKAGFLSLVAAVINCSYAVGSMKDTTVIFLSLVSMVLLMIATYFEYKGHSEMVKTLNPSLAKSWRNLWGLFIGIYIGVIVEGIIVSISYMLGLIMMFVFIAWGLAVTVLKLVYLYRTAQLFRRYAD